MLTIAQICSFSLGSETCSRVGLLEERGGGDWMREVRMILYRKIHIHKGITKTKIELGNIRF